MQRLTLLALVVASCSLAACKKKPPPETGSGSAILAGSGGVGSAAGSATGLGAGSGSTGSGSAVAAGERVLGSSAQATLATLTAKTTAEHKAYVVKGANDTFSIELLGGTGDAEVPRLTEFPIRAPNNKELNSTIIQLPAARGGMVMLAITTLDPLFKAGEGTPELVKKMFDGARDRSIADTGATLGKESEVTVAGAPGRVFDVSLEQAGQKANARMWMLFLAKPNLMLMVQAFAPEGDPLYARTDAMLKTLAVK